MASEHAKKLREVAAQLSTERFQGWANPLVGVITDAADFLDGAVTADKGDAVLSRPAPAATDTGLKTIGFVPPMFVEGKGADYNDIFRSVSIAENYTAVVTRSQAVELLAAERAEKEEARRAEEEAKDCFWSIYETYLERGGLPVSTEGARSALSNRIASLEADNAAKDARIDRLVDDYANLVKETVDQKEQIANLEDRLAAAEKALEQLRSDCQTPIDMYERNGPEFTSPHGNEYESTSYVMAKFAELVASIDEARAVLGGKPS